jgi:protoporphyrinogen oxidase
MTTKRIVVIGGGPTGLGAGYRLREAGYDNFVLYEKSDDVGGHSTSHVDEKGFTWDEGGHVIFSHYPYFDRLIDNMLGPQVNERVRESWIASRDFWVPYPFQNNLRYLPKPVQLRCLLGAARAATNGKGSTENFRDWILATFGEGIADAFMFPYNLKVWTTPLEQMSNKWIAERVAVVDFPRLLENVIYERDDVGWGPNSKFKFPLHGGTGEIYRRMARTFAPKIQTGKELVEIDTQRRRIGFSDGTGDTYDFLISTMPLDLLAKAMKPAESRLLDAAADLEHNNLLVLGVGLEKKIETTKCWIYFVDDDIPCYRATHFSYYSPFHVPDGNTDRFSSIMCEVSLPLGQRPDMPGTMEKVISGLIRATILEEADRNRVVTRYHRFVNYSYPIPTLKRDKALAILQPELKQRDVLSRGRFGAWRYEIGNMDHSVMMGVEAANHIISGDAETVFHST